MSFNKRYFTKENIFNRSDSDYQSFRTWVLNPDAHFLSDDFSKVFINSFIESNDAKNIMYSYNT